ncbi:hypothetical protein TNCV_3148151 [Trichonephila clavipes]|nr:hypothetical protein TNCV_3148151 [Trichonephila clavipes]
MDSDDVQELLDSHNQDLTIDELIEMQEQDNEKLEFLDPVQSEDRMTIRNLTEGISLTEKIVKTSENIDFNEENTLSTKQGIKKILA